MAELVEAVARAICRARGERPDMTYGSCGIAVAPDGSTTYSEHISHRQWNLREPEARAALAAIEAEGFVVVRRTDVPSDATPHASFYGQ